MKRRCPAPASLALALAAAVVAVLPASAQLPPPISPTLFSFPGAYTHPASGASAGLALADRWLADAPFDNPAIDPANRVVLSPALLHVSRQDLRKENRRYDETPAFVDGAGLELRARWRDLAVALYGHQPVLRLEDNAFNQGDPFVNPAVVTTTSTVREARGGLALSYGRGGWRVGAAAELTHRDDSYEYDETSGSPSSGTTKAAFSGDGAGFVVGARARLGPIERGGFEVGAGFRSVPALDLDGDQTSDLLTGSTRSDIRLERESLAEYGLSVRYAATEACRLLLEGGAHGAQDIRDRTSGAVVAKRGEGTEWALALDYHDARDPWGFRIGGGFEDERDVPEHRAGVFGIGGTWFLDSTKLDLGITHRSLRRTGQPNSYEDRIVLSVVQAL